MKDLSIIIPARNEIFLGKTIENLLENIKGNTVIVAVLDGYTIPVPDIPKDKRVFVINHDKSIGQRAACNEAAKVSGAKYIMKLDAHCSIDEGMDVKMLAEMHDDWTMVPTMRNLWAFDWKCPEGHTRYQGPSGPCEVCGKPTEKDMKWIAKTNPQSNSYCFDSEPHFQYFNDYCKRPEGKGDLTETMSLQGSCFMLSKEKWFDLNICDENFGSWGSQGIETAVKTWLSGGRVMVNHKTYYAHMFRTQGGDFSFPYQIGGRQVSRAKATARDLFFNNKWNKQIYPLSWLVEKFWPVKGWTDEDLAKLKESEKSLTMRKVPITKPLTKGIVYYTDNRLDPKIMKACQQQLLKASNGIPIVSVSLKPLDFGKNIVLDLDRGYLSMFKQILAGLEALDTDIVFFCEHDVLYPSCHFDFIPEKKDAYYYNVNSWQVRVDDGHAAFWDCCRLNEICAYRELLLEHYRKRVAKVIADGGYHMRMGFEPGSHRRTERVDDFRAETWMSKIPILDLKHEYNLTATRWNPSEFRNVRSCKNWQEKNVSEIKGWNFKEVLNGTA